jgi:hypothetical protein
VYWWSDGHVDDVGGVSFCFVEGRRFALGNGGVSGDEVGGGYNTVDSKDLLHEVVIKEEPLVFGW